MARKMGAGYENAYPDIRDALVSTSYTVREMQSMADYAYGTLADAGVGYRLLGYFEDLKRAIEVVEYEIQEEFRIRGDA